MKTSIHPYKGYLNTSFRIYADEPSSFQVFETNDSDNDVCILEGEKVPNKPCEIIMPHAGKYEIRFDNGTINEFFVEDGYKYGGNKFKNAFVFENCPWAFVVMHDRTYFYNRKTNESYVEAVSPDNIIEVSDDYVIFENNGQEVVSLYSLEEQKPILWVSDVEYFDNYVLCWSEQNEKDELRTLNIFSLETQEITHHISFDEYSIDYAKQIIYYHQSEGIFKLDLCADSSPVRATRFEMEFVTFVLNHYAVYLSHTQTNLVVCDLSNSEIVGEIPFEGRLARVNDKKIINLWSKYQSFKNFDFNTIELSEATLSCTYSEIIIYSFKWDNIFYTEKLTQYSSQKGRYRTTSSKNEKCYFKALKALKVVGSEINIIQELKSIDGIVQVTDRFFLFFNSEESVVIPKTYPHRMEYRVDSKVYCYKKVCILQSKNEICVLSRNGFWDHSDIYDGDFDLSKYELYGVAIRKTDKQCVFWNGNSIGKYISDYTRQPFPFLRIGDYRIYEGGIIIMADDCPEYTSYLLKYGLYVEKEGVYLGCLNKESKYDKQEILQDIYDSSEYHNVLFSENGQQIIYRNINTSTMLNLATGETTDYENLSYISHINGIRPFIRITETSQAILVNPIDGLPVDCSQLVDYQFVSPDNHYYADKALGKYIEYYNQISKKLISTEDYLQLIKDFEYPFSDKDERKETIRQNRWSFIHMHYDFLFEQILKWWPCYENKPKEEIIKMLSSENYDVYKFVDLFVEKRSVAVIRHILDDSEFVRIYLGQPLWFLNYVAFSKDSHYVAIVGRYPNDSNYGGLFLVYDLEKKEIVTKKTNSNAVWTVSFSQNDAIAAYTSNPNTFFAKCPEDYKEAASKDQRIDDYNFLTFSPDGKYFACSKQGYIPYKKPDGTIRLGWGHQPSSLVSIRSTQNPKVELVSFNDLSEMGIADTMKRSSVASVSFSNDNSKIMMVGNDGTVIVRNLYLRECESSDKHSNFDALDKGGFSYGEFAGTYAQDVMGFSDDAINDAFEGDPDACWNID